MFGLRNIAAEFEQILPQNLVKVSAELKKFDCRILEGLLHYQGLSLFNMGLCLLILTLITVYLHCASKCMCIPHTAF